MSTAWTSARSLSRSARPVAPSRPDLLADRPGEDHPPWSLRGIDPPQGEEEGGRADAVVEAAGEDPVGADAEHPLRHGDRAPGVDAERLGLPRRGDPQIDRRRIGERRPCSAVHQSARGSKTAATGPRSPWTRAACASQTEARRPPRFWRRRRPSGQHLLDAEADLVLVGDEQDGIAARGPIVTVTFPALSVSGFAQAGRFRSTSSRTGASAPLTP